jgi:hypothetical protein
MVKMDRDAFRNNAGAYSRYTVFPFLRKLNGGEKSIYSKYMRDASFTIPTAPLLAEGVKIINDRPIKERNRDFVAPLIVSAFLWCSHPHRNSVSLGSISDLLVKASVNPIPRTSSYSIF